MGNGCFYGSNNTNTKEVNLEESITKDKDNKNSTDKKNQINKPLNTEGKESKKNKMSQIIDYFNQEEMDMMKEYKERNKKKKNISKKNNNEKYEIILHRLLEQQKIKMIGPKRRETIRKEGKKIQDLVQEILQENKNDILKGTKAEINSTLIIKKPLQKNSRASVTIDKNPLSMANHKRGNNFFQKRNSLNEMISKSDLANFQKNIIINSQADF